MIPIPGIPNDWRAVLALGAVGLIVYWVIKSDVKAAARAVGEAVNPLSDRNLVNRAVSATGSALTGQRDFSLGSWIYDVFHDDANVESDRRARELLSLRAPSLAPVQPQDKPTIYLRG